MKTYVQYFQMSTGYIAGTIPPRYSEEAKKPIEATGDRSVIQLDGRTSKEDQYTIARTVGKQRGYIGYRLMKGQSLLRANYCSGYIKL